jgi:hypothetical protein
MVLNPDYARLPKRLNELRLVGSLETQNLGCGYTTSLSLGKGAYDDLPLAASIA